MCEDAGRTPALEEIYKTYAGPVSRLCSRLLRSREAARDAAQEVWIEIMRSLPSFEGRSSFSTWLWTVARRTAFRHLKKEKTYSTRFLGELFSLRADDGMDEMERIPTEDRSAWVRLQCDECLTAILHCLGNDDRFIYLLRTLARLSYLEIASVVEMEEATVRQRHSRNLRKLGRFLNAECMLYNPAGKCRCKLASPIRAVDCEGEYLRVRELSRRLLFINAADSYHPPKDYWRGLLTGAQLPVAR